MHGHRTYYHDRRAPKRHHVHPVHVVCCLIGVLAVGCLDANEHTTPDRNGTFSGVDGGDPNEFNGPDITHPVFAGGGYGYGGNYDGSVGPDGSSSDMGSDTGSEDAPIGECDEARPCADPFICVENRCQPECEARAQCDDQFTCVDLQCVPIECAQDDACDVYTEYCSADGLCETDPCNVIAFRYDPQAASHTSVHIAGEFNADMVGQWPETIAAGGYALSYVSADGVWFGKFEIPNGVYEYRLVLDETTWIEDPSNPDHVANNNEEFNSLLTVDCTDTPVGGLCDPEVFDWRDPVMYFIIVDRFFDSDNSATPVNGATDGDATIGASGQYEGGDLAGITAQMSYLTDLGVTALWLTAPYDNRDIDGAAVNPEADPNRYSGYHGYWPSPANITYTGGVPDVTPAVESRLGSSNDLTAVVTAAHGADSANGHGLKVLFDYVMNHVDAESGLYQAHEDWFAENDSGETVLCGPTDLWNDSYWGTRCAFTSYLPPFDFDKAAPRAWSVADALWWATTYDIDGYRLDAIKHVSTQWLEDLRSGLNSNISEPDGGRFYLVGETFAYEDRDLLAEYIDPATRLDGQFDFPFKWQACEAFFNRSVPLSDFATWMAENDDFYVDGTIMTTWIGNHDVPRPIHFASGQITNCRQGSDASNGWTSNFSQPVDAAPYERLGLVFTVMMTSPGIPLIYYGDEIGLAGGGDPDNRRMMPWNDGALSQAQLDLRSDVTALAHIRAENPVLGRGTRITRSADADTWVYSMIGCGSDSPNVTVAINRGDSQRSVNIPAGDYVDLMAGDAARSGGSVTLEPRSFLVWRTQTAQ